MDFVYINLLYFGKNYENTASEIYDIHIQTQIKDYDRRQFCFIEIPESKKNETTLVVINQIKDNDNIYNISSPFIIQVDENCSHSFLVNQILTSKFESIDSSLLKVKIVLLFVLW